MTRAHFYEPLLNKLLEAKPSKVTQVVSAFTDKHQNRFVKKKNKPWLFMAALSPKERKSTTHRVHSLTSRSGTVTTTQPKKILSSENESRWRQVQELGKYYMASEAAKEVIVPLDQILGKQEKLHPTLLEGKTAGSLADNFKGLQKKLPVRERRSSAIEIKPLWESHTRKFFDTFELLKESLPTS